MPRPPEINLSETTIPTEGLALEFLLNERWARWKESKFDIPKQITKLVHDYCSASQTGENPSEAIDEWALKTTEDLGAFWGEFLCQHLVLPIKLKREVVEGKTEIVCPYYGGQKLVEATSPQERNGAEKEAIIKIANFLSAAPPSSMAIFISPKGWSGLTGPDGIAKDYPETQLYLYQIDLLGQIKALTIRTDLNLSQCRTLYYILHGGQILLEAEGNKLIESIVRNPILQPGKETAVSFEEIITTVQKIKGTDWVVSYVENRFWVRRTFAELWEHFRQRFTLAEQDQETRAIIGWFKQKMNRYLSLTPDSLEEIAEMLEKTITGISNLRNPGRKTIDITGSPPTLTQEEVKAELAYIQSRRGCVAEGNNPTVEDSPFGPKVVAGRETGTEYAHCGRCPGKTGRFKKGQTICGNAIRIS